MCLLIATVSVHCFSITFIFSLCPSKMAPVFLVVAVCIAPMIAVLRGRDSTTDVKIAHQGTVLYELT